MSECYRYKTGENDTWGVLEALRVCKEEGRPGLCFEKGEYHFYEEYGVDEYCCISNHGLPGNKRCAFPLKEFENFTVDGGGSVFYFHGVMLPFLVSHANHVTLKNFTVIVTNPCSPQGEIIGDGDGYTDLKIRTGERWDVRNGQFCAIGDKWEVLPAFNANFFEKETKKMVPGSGDFWPGSFPAERLGPEEVRIFHRVKQPVGSIMAFMTCPRLSAGIFMRNSSSVTVSDVTVHSCFGMSVIAQLCDTVTLERVRVTPAEGSWLSANADATHFVNCTGTIRLQDCLFENQFDDALNIHGIYLKIKEAGPGWAIAQMVHPDQKGVEICFAGDTLAFMDQELLIPDSDPVTVKSAELINNDYVRLSFEESVCVPTGFVMENLTRQADLIMTGCTVRSNRARGMLLATKGKTVIENNYFNSTGCAILFECDGSNWYESGSVRDAVIRRNTFEDCCYCDWGNDVICIAPRKKEAEGKYYHGRIEVSGNAFATGGKNILYANNVTDLIVRDNKITDGNPGGVVMHHVRRHAVQEDIACRVE